MSVTRRDFIVYTTYAGAGLCSAGLLDSFAPWASAEEAQLKPYLTGMRMSATPATNYQAYRSRVVANPDHATWVQVDLKKSVRIEAIQLFPASQRMYPGRDEYYAGESFPLRFRIEASDNSSFSSKVTIADLTYSDFPDPKDNITQFVAHGVHARYVRLTATRLRPVKTSTNESLPSDSQQKKNPEYTLMLAKIAVLSNGRDIAVDCSATDDDNYGNSDLLAQLTRPARQDGEEMRHDHPHAVTDPATWKQVKYKAHAPKTGVTLDGGLFQTAMQNNIEYLLNSFTTEQLLRQFYERTGKIRDFKATGDQVFWEEDLAGSNAGRFLMGAANTLRWIDHPELRRRVNEVVDGIEECRQPNGYIMAYPEDTIFYSERGAYTRAWLTHGLLEAAYSGNEKALPMLRGYYDWFNEQSFLPLMLRGAIQGGQGMIANTRVATSPVGEPADVQVIQRYFQEDVWLAGLARREKEQIWQYPYDRPHCYLLTNLEAYLDMYLITGNQLYYDAVLGAWELYRDHWQQAGGSISIIEFEKDPPDSNSLRRLLGELCGNSFWVFLSQRFQQLHPDDERYTTEIEKSIYNVGIANQDGGKGLRYHTVLEDRKEKGTHFNSCCEGQGTRLLGSLPEHIYSIAEDGLYLHLYEPSTIRWQNAGQDMELTIKTSFPFDTTVCGTVKTAVPAKANIRIRVPSWAAGEMKIAVNGEVAGTGKPGSYIQLNRQWLSGDVIEFSLPAAFRVSRYKGVDQVVGKSRYSIEYGPILLAVVGSLNVDLLIDKDYEPQQVADCLKPVEGAPLHFTVRGNPGCRLMPYWQIADEEFTCYPTITARA
jgi:hypothetical protein